jgi:predicted metal-dependent phosphoesterase TrpH
MRIGLAQLVVVGALCQLGGPLALVALDARQPARESEVVLDGTLTFDDYERILERAFDVPAGTERIDLELAYDEAERTVIDLGLRGPMGFRGWSGGGPQRVWVDAFTAAYGYSPGAPEPGRWTVLLGVPNIRRGVRANYTVRIRFNAPAPRPQLSATARWYTGDLHSHSGHSDGRTQTVAGERIKVPPVRVFEAARAAGLDFIALTDHNTTSHWADVERLQPLYSSLLLLHAREVTTYRGHMNAFGERRFVPFIVDPARSTRTIASQLRTDGAFVSINHPASPDDESCMGCGWNDDDAATIDEIDGIEVVNGDGIEGPRAGWPYWTRLLNRGHRLVAVGGSDEHTPDETADRRIGTPATVVFAQSHSESAIVDGLKSGRVYVRTRGADGPAIEFTAESSGRTYQMGTVLPANVTEVRFVVQLTSAEGQQLEWIRNGEVVGRAPVDSTGRLTLAPSLPAPGAWFSVVVRDGKGPTLFSNAIYLSRAMR